MRDKKKEEYGCRPFEVEREKAAAWVAFAEGKVDEGLKELRGVADREEADGVDSLAMPAREMLADMLLEAKRPEQALTEYEAALKVSPNRFDGLYGAARAAQLAGKTAKATGYYAELRAISDHANGDRTELEEAKLFLARE
jgi:tetratricopeptide (TPR) repeat protein